MAFKGDDNIDWDHHWRDEQAGTPDFKGTEAFDYFKEYLPRAPFAVLDLGCGFGRWFPMWQELGAMYVGIDASPVAIKSAQERHPNEAASFFLLKAQDLDEEDTYDVVFCHAFLQHTNLESKRAIFPRVHAALKPGGLFIYQEKNDGHADTFFQEEEWIAFTESFGFKLLKSTGKNTRQNGFVFRKV